MKSSCIPCYGCLTCRWWRELETGRQYCRNRDNPVISNDEGTRTCDHYEKRGKYEVDWKALVYGNRGLI